MAYTRQYAFHLQNIFSRLSVPMYGIVLQMLVFIVSNCGGFSIVLYVVTVLLKYLTDCSIRVSRSFIIFFWGEACALCAPLWICH